ncbi:MAG: polysaccharide biosynthesis protein [Deltaproteobacteria bacterium]|nr:polysaccharide biosynthesis protein [Deltaproteobacteria bacterium]
MPFLVRHRQLVAIATHLGIAAAAYLAAFALRFDLELHPRWLAMVAATLPLLLACKLVGFWSARLFGGSWRHVSVHDVEDIARGNLLASTLFLAVMVFTHGLRGFPRSVFLLDLLLCTLAMGAIRVGIRLARERGERRAVRRIETLALIVGAGSAGIKLLQEIEQRRRLRVGVVGFLDDDPRKIGLRVCGTPVLGGIDDLPGLVAAHEIGEVLIALPAASGAVIRRVVQHCTTARVRHRVLPTLAELVDGRVMYTQMREVKVGDLLARDAVRLDLPRVAALVAGRTVIVTGAAGSIGSELCRQVAAYGPARLVLYDRHENGMFVLEMELRTRFPDVALVPVLGDVLLVDQLERVFSTERPDLVLHAAAYKHVPLAELNVLEAVRNNVLGTHNVARAALAHGTSQFVMVSTDKAVRPTSVMGVTKRVAELVVKNLHREGRTRFAAVRFGNVLGSNGSVVPIFREQIARGGPVTVTHPEVTRYFMTIPEAVQLILQAATIGGGGETFVLEMGEPVKIVDLARQMIRLSGFEPDEDIAIEFSGLRPGEKLYEELVAEGEEQAATPHERIRVLVAQEAPPPLVEWLGRIEDGVAASDTDAVMRTIRMLVPAYTASASLLATLAGASANRGESGLRHAGEPGTEGGPGAGRGGVRLRRLPPRPADAAELSATAAAAPPDARRAPVG